VGRLLQYHFDLGVAWTSNEKKMSDGGRERASVGVEVWKSSQKWSVQRSVVRSIAWLDVLASLTQRIPSPRRSTGGLHLATYCSEAGNPSGSTLAWQ
jgi:hypothetical protein